MILNRNEFLNQEITIKLTLGEAKVILRDMQDYIDYFMQPNTLDYQYRSEMLYKIYEEVIKYEKILLY